MNNIVSTPWLKRNLNNPNLVILDASVPETANGKPNKYPDITIPNARAFDLKNAFKDKSSPFSNTVPTPEHFETECQKLGINQDSQIVVFDNFGVYNSPRVWWLFHVMGHTNIAVLNGGLPEWINQGYETVAKTEKQYVRGDFKATYNEELVITFDEVVKNSDSKNFTIIDARSEGRFKGTSPEPRQHLRSGCIPNSINIPYASVLNNNKFKSKADLNIIFEKCFDSDAEYVFSCGSGMTACIVMLAFETITQSGKKVYDGSWTEWAELNRLYVRTDTG